MFGIDRQLIFYFRNGKVHMLELTINGNPDQISVEIGGEINDWN